MSNACVARIIHSSVGFGSSLDLMKRLVDSCKGDYGLYTAFTTEMPRAVGIETSFRGRSRSRRCRSAGVGLEDEARSYKRNNFGREESDGMKNDGNEHQVGRVEYVVEWEHCRFFLRYQ